MNNTTKADCVRAILSRKASKFEIETCELHHSIKIREITHKIDNLKITVENNKTLEAINFLLDSLNY